MRSIVSRKDPKLPPAVRHSPLFSGVSLGARNFLSRGTTIITQKENKGEYHSLGYYDSNYVQTGITDGSSQQWYWNNDQDIYAHVMDQNGPKDSTNNIPIRYASNSTNYRNTNNIPQCTSDYSITSGGTLYSGTKITNQYSCKPYSDNPSLNVGNYYSFPAATAGSDNSSVTSANKDMPNSICPKGWQLPPNDGEKSYNNLIRTAYGITTSSSDSTLLSNTAMSFVRLGYYYYVYGSLGGRGDRGYHWSSTANSTNSYFLVFYSRSLNPKNSNDRSNGMPIRCVSR